MAGTATRWGDLMAVGEARRQEVRRRPGGNGLDTVEVDHGGRRLILTFLERAPEDVHPGNVRVTGPHGTPPLTATRVRRVADDDAQLEERLIVDLARPGRAGAYTLRLVEPTADGAPGWVPLHGLDPRFTQAGFTFDVDRPNPVTAAPPAGAQGGGAAQASYLARDYEGLRQLILDRLAETMPAWTETHVADIGITLVELLAYVGDDLSYYQDAVATEAYLQTARRRISVRRHARLVDYRLGEGVQARAWVALAVGEAAEVPLGDLLLVAAPGLAPGAAPRLGPAALLPAGPGPARPFTPVTPTPAATVSVDPAHNQIPLWAWGARSSWLTAGATSAVLVDAWTDPAENGPAGPRRLHLRPGQVVILEATVDPSGDGPPDPTQRHAVRLTAVRRSVDELYDQPIVEIAWAEPDALPFDLQVSAVGPSGAAVTCSVASANAVLAGDGSEVTEALDQAPFVLSHGPLAWACPYPDPAAVARHQALELHRLPARWRREVEEWRHEVGAGAALGRHRRDQLRRLLGSDVLTRLGLAGGRTDDDSEGLRRLLLAADRLLVSRVRRLGVLSALARASGPLGDVLIGEVAEDWGTELAARLSPDDPAAWGPASAATDQDAGLARPRLSVAPVGGDGGPWTTVADLVGSRPGSRQVMVEVDDAGLGHLRFSPGDEPLGSIVVTYQVGGGVAGNVPAGAINAIVATVTPAPPALSVVEGVGNPLPAVGGTDPEGITAAKVALPGAYLIDQPRAIVAADYTALAARVPGVGAAATVLRWTGTGYAAEVAVQPRVGEDPGEELLAAVDEVLRPQRRIGHELWVRPPIYRPLVVALTVDLGADAVRTDVAATLDALLGPGWQADGTPALFHPARLGFGQSVYASAVLAAVQAVAGVESAVLTRFAFLAPPGSAPAAAVGDLTLRALEIARVDNDPDAPEHGYAVVTLQGGR